ncbi:MAG: hypothetical protein JO335_10780 [Sphingomonas sp.]|nr:hypothetical protein [Sphingomonas sp.]
MAVGGVQIWFGVMLGVAGVLALTAIVRRRLVWLVAAGYLAGTSAQLGLTDPEWFGSLQLRPDPFALLCFGVVGLQSAITATVLLARGRAAAMWKGISALGLGRVVLLFLLLLGSTAAPMGFLQQQKYGRFAVELLADTGFLALDGAGLIALAMLLPKEWLASASRRINAILSDSSKRLPWLAALWVFAATLFLNLVAFNRLPRTDEVHYLFQAKTFALGHLYALAPGGAMDTALQPGSMMFVDGKWFSMFPPGWPAALAVGGALGVPFLVNPVIAALTVPIGHAFLSRWVSPRLAVMTTLLLMVSPWYLAMGASMFSHPLTLLLILSAWLLMLTEGSRRPPAWFAAGCLLGWLSLTRPLEGLTIGVLTGLWALTRVDRKAIGGWVSILVYSAGCAVVGSLIFPYNHVLTGDALQTPINLYFDSIWHHGANRLGFGSDIGSPDSWGGLDVWPGHSPLEALVEAQFNLKALNVELFGWAVGSLVLLYVHLLWGRISRADWCMLAVIGATVATYALYWFNGAFDIGPRYWFMLIWPSLFLSARGLQTASEALGRAKIADGRETLAAMVLLLTTAAVLSFLPWRATGRYWGARGAHSTYRDFAATGVADNALVFVKGGRSDYANAFALNSPDLAGPIFLRDQGAANAQIIARYPGRRVYMVSSADLQAGRGPIRVR